MHLAMGIILTMLVCVVHSQHTCSSRAAFQTRIAALNSACCIGSGSSKCVVKNSQMCTKRCIGELFKFVHGCGDSSWGSETVLSTINSAIDRCCPSCAPFCLNVDSCRLASSSDSTPERRTACTNHVCEHGGVCRDASKTGHRRTQAVSCTCDENWTGSRCERPRNSCNGSIHSQGSRVQPSPLSVCRIMSSG